MTFLKSLCCCSGNSSKKQQARLPMHRKQPITEETGCYLTRVDNHIIIDWSYTLPSEGVIMFAQCTTKPPEIKLSKYKTDMGEPVSSEHFFQMIIEFFKEVATYKPVLYIDPEADTTAYVPFLLLFHSQGNGIIGGHTKTLSSSQHIEYHQSIDCIGIMELPESPLKIPNQNLIDFLNTCKNLNAVTFKIDGAGKTPLI